MAFSVFGERWLNHYSSFHRILLVGEGDFSFSLSLARSFGDASNIVATSFDSYDALIMKYRDAKKNLQDLHNLGALLLHGLDATKMKLRPDLIHRRFDRIIFNFPHAGFYGKEDDPQMIEMHQELVFGFFHNASAMLRAGGEVHVSHKTSPPYSLWNLEELASKTSLALIGLADFRADDYLGYKNKRGHGQRCDEPFSLGKCCTFKFVFSSAASKSLTNQQRPASSGRLPIDPASYGAYQGLGYGHFQPHLSLLDGSSAVHHVFEWLLNLAKELNGQFGKSTAHIMHLGIRRGYERYVSLYGADNPAGFTDLLVELHQLLTHGGLFRLADLLVR